MKHFNSLRVFFIHRSIFWTNCKIIVNHNWSENKTWETLFKSFTLTIARSTGNRSLCRVSETLVPVEHVAEAAPESLRHHAVQQRVDTAAQVISDTYEKKLNLHFTN